MYQTEIIAEIESGALTVRAYESGTCSRLYPIMDDIDGDYIDVGRYGKDNVWHPRMKWYGKILDYERRIYPRINYYAEYKDGSAYRINKTIYEKYKK